MVSAEDEPERIDQEEARHFNMLPGYVYSATNGTRSVVKLPHYVSCKSFFIKNLAEKSSPLLDWRLVTRCGSKLLFSGLLKHPV
jgi:hypothetical protein